MPGSQYATFGVHNVRIRVLYVVKCRCTRQYWALSFPSAEGVAVSKRTFRHIVLEIILGLPKTVWHKWIICDVYGKYSFLHDATVQSVIMGNTLFFTLFYLCLLVNMV